MNFTPRAPELGGASGPSVWPWSATDTLSHLRGFVADLAGLHGKSAELVIEADGVPMPRSIVAAALPAIVQLLRNAVLHGIETPVDRLMAGKPLTGRVTIMAIATDDGIAFIVSDDGAGIDIASVPWLSGGGLSRAAARVAPIGGSITVSPSGEGTAARLELFGAGAFGRTG